MATDELPWEAYEREYVPPFSVAELLLTSLDGFLTAAALHMGDKLEDGRGLQITNATECWLALMGATGLLVELAPMLNDEIKKPYEATLAKLLARYADAFPEQTVAPPTKRPLGTLRNILEEAWAGVTGDEAPAPSAETKPTTPEPAKEAMKRVSPTGGYYGASSRPLQPGSTGPIRLNPNLPGERR